jgi:hypothetical protein
MTLPPGYYLDWPAMAMALIGSYLVGNTSIISRRRGFIIYLVSNALWITWGVATHNWPLAIMSLAFCYTSGRGWVNARRE